MTKRGFDIICALSGLLLLSPVLLLSALVILIFSPGPIFYSQLRVGKSGKLFRLRKFRTMVVGADKMPGGSITVCGDTRITSIGKYLRKWKLDELPSLWNVLLGDMSIVGPRPDVLGYADQLQGDDRWILQLKPGITGPATLKYANEEEILAKVEDPIKYNNEILFPQKVRINLDYLNNRSFWSDIQIIFQTLYRIIQKR
jgi:lipopolysaccharide/colanic/teichoic acid biosynthesis glycosyltransferase